MVDSFLEIAQRTYKYPSLWKESYPEPTVTVFLMGYEIYQIMLTKFGLVPTRITPSCESALFMSYRRGDKDIGFEVYNETSSICFIQVQGDLIEEFYTIGELDAFLNTFLGK